MASLYLLDDLEGVEVGARLSLTGAEARHAATVSRIRPGEAVRIGDGRGTLASGEVRAATSSEVTVVVSAVERIPRPAPAITLVQALAKADRDELAVQAATELGVDAVLPWAAYRSVSRWEGAKVAKGCARWAAIVREASKQSVRAWTPDVGQLATTKEVAALAAAHRLLVLAPGAETRLADIRPDARPLALVVGPEGGVAPDELDAFRRAGAEVVRLGPSVLRTSTAGPAALAVLNVLLARW